jgi:hypothetical protein
MRSWQMSHCQLENAILFSRLYCMYGSRYVQTVIDLTVHSYATVSTATARVTLAISMRTSTTGSTLLRHVSNSCRVSTILPEQPRHTDSLEIMGLKPYLDLFFPGWSPPGPDTSNIVANIIVILGCDRPTGYRNEKTWNRTVNYFLRRIFSLRLIRLLAAAPKVSIIALSEEGNVDHQKIEEHSAHDSRPHYLPSKMVLLKDLALPRRPSVDELSRLMLQV